VHAVRLDDLPVGTQDTFLRFTHAAGRGLGFVAEDPWFGALLRGWPRPPWRRGWYLFPALLVDARDTTLYVHDLPPLGDALFLDETTDRVIARHERRELSFKTGEDPRAAWSTFLIQHQLTIQAAATGDWARLARYHPFAECVCSGQWGIATVPGAATRPAQLCTVRVT